MFGKNSRDRPPATRETSDASTAMSQVISLVIAQNQTLGTSLPIGILPQLQHSQDPHLAVVAQGFNWEDQIQALNLSGGEEVNLAQVNKDTEAMDAEEKMMGLQFAFMESDTPKPAKISL